MKLASYLHLSQLTRSEFGRRIGVSSEAVRLWLAEKRTPRPEQMARIIRATDGAVTANDFLPRDDAGRAA